MGRNMNKITLPYKITTAGGNALRYHIEVSLGLSNPNTIPIWVDSIISLTHRRGWLSGGEDELWVRYHPVYSMQVDFAQKRMDDRLRKGGLWPSLRTIIFGEPDKKYGFPDNNMDFAISANVASEIRINLAPGQDKRPPTIATGAAVRLPPGEVTTYRPELVLPGPSASPGMREFWSEYDSPDFDIEFQIIELNHYNRQNAPKPDTSGQAIFDMIMLEDAVEIDLDEDVERGEF